MPLNNPENYFLNGGLPVKAEESQNKYRYKVFGLQVASEILLPDMLTATDALDIPEVRIRLGEVSIGINDAEEINRVYQVAENQVLFRVPGVGSYYVANGSSIVVEPVEQAEERIVRLFLLGTAFGALLMQRGILPIHGSAVVFDNCCVIFTGVSGAGKSTLLAAFRERGYPFLTDDVAAVTIDASGIAWVHPAYPQQKLWRDSAEMMGIDTASLTPFYNEFDRDKFNVPIRKGFWASPLPLVAVYELGVERCREVNLRSLEGMEKLAVLISHTYRPWLLNRLGLKAVHLRQCAAVARRISVSCLTRPEGVFSMGEQIRLIQQDLARCLADRAV